MSPIDFIRMVAKADLSRMSDEGRRDVLQVWQTYARKIERTQARPTPTLVPSFDDGCVVEASHG